MAVRCPGKQGLRHLDSVIVPCPGCGQLIEFFTDEAKRPCRCGRILLREALPQCADWCPAAAECLGQAIDLYQIIVFNVSSKVVLHAFGSADQFATCTVVVSSLLTWLSPVQAGSSSTYCYLCSWKKDSTT